MFNIGTAVTHLCACVSCVYVRLEVHPAVVNGEGLWAADKGGRQIGTVTSTATGLDGQPVALGYLRCRAKGAQVPPAL